MAHYKYKAKITDDIEDAREIVRNVGRTLREGKTDFNSVMHNLIAALEKFESARYWIDRE